MAGSVHLLRVGCDGALAAEPTFLGITPEAHDAVLVDDGAIAVVAAWPALTELRFFDTDGAPSGRTVLDARGAPRLARVADGFALASSGHSQTFVHTALESLDTFDLRLVLGWMIRRPQSRLHATTLLSVLVIGARLSWAHVGGHPKARRVRAMVEWMEPAAKPAVVDTTFYAVREKVGEELLQRLIMETLRPLIAAWLVEQGRTALVGADQFFYYEQFNPKMSVAPDVYVVDGVAPDTPVTAWKTWETGAVPSFAVEIVSGDRLKDYEDAPKRHADLGTGELVIYDPHHAEGPGSRARWQVYRRDGDALVRIERSNADRVWSLSLGCWLREVGEGTAVRVRVATEPDGDTLLPTEAERQAARAEREADRAERAEAEVERLRARLAELAEPRDDE